MDSPIIDLTHLQKVTHPVSDSCIHSFICQGSQWGHEGMLAFSIAHAHAALLFSVPRKKTHVGGNCIAMVLKALKTALHAAFCILHRFDMVQTDEDKRTQR